MDDWCVSGQYYEVVPSNDLSIRFCDKPEKTFYEDMNIWIDSGKKN